MKRVYCCKDCADKICYNNANFGSGLCRKCAFIGKRNPNYKEGKSFNNKCFTCKKHISFSAKFCRSCSSIGNNNSNYKNGLPKCIDCKTKYLSNYINKRCFNCNNKNNEGKNNPNWKDGISLLPYSYKFTKSLKLKIRTRDNFICQNCGLKEEDSYRNLDIHHIDYNKMNCKDNNLITLCSKCNIKANFNRDYWINFYQLMISEG